MTTIAYKFSSNSEIIFEGVDKNTKFEITFDFEKTSKEKVELFHQHIEDLDYDTPRTLSFSDNSYIKIYIENSKKNIIEFKKNGVFLRFNFSLSPETLQEIFEDIMIDLDY